MTEHVTVLGDGGWGTALAIVLSDHGADVRLWSHDPDYARSMQATRRNPRFLPGVVLPDAIEVTADLAEAMGFGDIVFSVVPTPFLRAVHREARAYHRGQPVVSATKGIDTETLELPSQILRGEFGEETAICVVSGPSHAEEVARRMPTTVVAASPDMGLARRVQDLLATDRFRVYTQSDALGVELGGALKNVVAIAGGIVDGLGYGDNTKAALMTRGIVEMSRLGEAMGARRSTFFGLSGIGDLITSCISEHGRNRQVGRRIGRGEKLDDVLAGMQQVAEGVRTSKAVHRLAERHSVEMPICSEVYAVLFEDKEPARAVHDLMTRNLKEEDEW